MATPPRRRSRTHSQHSAKSPQHRRRAFIAVERLWGRLTDLLGAGPTKQSTPTFNLAPRRLEPRRMLDAAGGAMALEMVAVSTVFAPASDSADAPPVANLDANTPPSGIDVQTPIVINEDGVATLSLTFVDPDPLDTHTVEIDWQDGTTEVFSLAAGETSFSTTHQYLDDNLTGPATEDYDVTIRVNDSAGDFAETTAKISVLNVAPSNLQVSPIAPISENGVATLNLNFDDPGTLDSHQVEINWGDGSAAQVFNVPPGDRTFSATHKYLDDNPSGTSSDNYTVSVRLIDDDLGQTTATAVAKVNNVAPSNVQVKPVANILNEGGAVALTVTFDDPGTQDTHQVEINWGDGNTTIANAAGHTLSANHTYGDNATYAIIVKVIDDDGGVGFGSAAALVSNVPPTNVKIDPIAPIDENGVALLKLTFDDPGTLDSHTVEVDWGDGTVETIAVAAGSRTFTANHKYLDDNPTGTAADNYTVNVKVRDDDGGQATGSAVAKVTNVPPSNVLVSPVATITSEGTQVNLGVTFADPGTQDTHQVEINWGDGTITTGTAVGHALSASHTYDDNGTYAVVVKVVDDDGGTGFGSAAVQVNNAPPANLQIAPIASIDENGVATLDLTFDDPGTLDSHTVEINWGDGTVETLTVAAGGRSLTATHQYLDDNPTGTSSDVYTVNVTVRDDDGGQAVASQTVTVSNLAPSNVQIAPIVSIDENGVATLNLTFDDPGSLDSHTVEINWGDGTVQTLAVVAGARTLTATHQYLDDNPTGTSSDVYTVNMTVRDDDGGQASASQTVTVSNVAPSNVQVAPIVSIDENGVATLNLTFADPGSLDAHSVEVNWGDGTVETLAVAAGARTFTATHQYLDDNPTGTSSDVYTVYVAVRDDDGGQASASQTVTVSNVAPLNIQIAPIVAIDENGVATLNLTFDDPGSVDSHTVEINWGDGTVETLVVAAGARTFTATHRYLDDNPTNTQFDVYTVNVTVRDDDGGLGTASATVTVNNVPPAGVVATPSAGEINEGGGITLDVTFDDVGSQDTHTYVINWGDGHQTVGAATGHGFQANHVYADNGTYAITVTVTDDDSGVGAGNTSIIVNNVAPSLDLSNADLTVNEGAAINLAGLGVTATDPGFKNELGGTNETFVQGTVDWGDGTTPTDLAVAVSEGGGVGKLTRAAFSHADHHYADNGTYTVTVTFADDDGGVLSQQFTIVVENVAPTLTLTDRYLEVEEGKPLDISDLATFFDPGFKNDLNPNGPSDETFKYVINWGDNSQDTSGDVVAFSKGSAGVTTKGSFSATHFYADNDSDGTYDNKYTITVTLKDDDGGIVTQQIVVTVINVKPTITSILATDVNTKGETTLTLTFDDPGDDDFTVEVDWGDGKTIIPIAVSQLQSDQRTFQYTYTYTEPPNNSAADITLTARVLDDDARRDGVQDNSPSDPASVTISQPGLGAEKFRIDTSPKVAILTFPDRSVVPLLQTTADARLVTVTTSDDGGGGGDSRATSERYLELRVINPDGSEGPGYRLPSQVLNNLPALFRNLPDNHYKIFLVQSETNARRLVIEVFVRNGKLIDPGDDSEGARDRPPTEEATTRPIEPPPMVAPAEGAAAPAEEPPVAEPQAAVEAGRRLRSSTAIYHGATLAGVAIALSGAGKSSCREINDALAKAKPEQWKRLRSAAAGRPKKPR